MELATRLRSPLNLCRACTYLAIAQTGTAPPGTVKETWSVATQYADKTGDHLGLEGIERAHAFFAAVTDCAKSYLSSRRTRASLRHSGSREIRKRYRPRLTTRPNPRKYRTRGSLGMARWSRGHDAPPATAARQPQNPHQRGLSTRATFPACSACVTLCCASRGSPDTRRALRGVSRVSRRVRHYFAIREGGTCPEKSTACHECRPRS